MPTASVTESVAGTVRSAVSEALTVAYRGGLYLVPNGCDPDATVATLTGRVLTALAATGVDRFDVGVLAAATPVLTVDVRDVIAAAARAALDRDLDRDPDPQRPAATGTGAVSEAMDAGVTTVEIARDYPAARVRAFRHALWPLSAMFGVRLWTVDGGEGRLLLRIGGRPGDIVAFQTAVLDTFVPANIENPTVAALGEDDEAVFWSTLADLVLRHGDNAALATAGVARQAAGQRALLARYGRPRSIARVPAAGSGAIRDLAAAAFAESPDLA